MSDLINMVANLMEFMAAWMSGLRTSLILSQSNINETGNGSIFTQSFLVLSSLEHITIIGVINIFS